MIAHRKGSILEHGEQGARAKLKAIRSLLSGQGRGRTYGLMWAKGNPGLGTLFSSQTFFCMQRENLSPPAPDLPRILRLPRSLDTCRVVYLYWGGTLLLFLSYSSCIFLDSTNRACFSCRYASTGALAFFSSMFWVCSFSHLACACCCACLAFFLPLYDRKPPTNAKQTISNRSFFIFPSSFGFLGFRSRLTDNRYGWTEMQNSCRLARGATGCLYHIQAKVTEQESPR